MRFLTSEEIEQADNRTPLQKALAKAALERKSQSPDSTSNLDAAISNARQDAQRRTTSNAVLQADEINHRTTFMRRNMRVTTPAEDTRRVILVVNQKGEVKGE